VREQLLEVDVRRSEVVYRLRQGAGLTIWHRGEEVHVTPGTPETRPLGGDTARGRRSGG
jgi:hypothetical protein